MDSSATKAPGSAPGARSIARPSPSGASPERRDLATDRSDTPGAPGSESGQPDAESIRRRAYQLYLERGGRDGADFDDWLRAEQELKRRR